MASTKRKGDLAELKVATDLVDQGFQVAIPFGEDSDFDLIFVDGPYCQRVQVKYAASDGTVIDVSCRSASLTNGKVRAYKKYTAVTVDWIAVYDATSEQCYYIPATELGDGRCEIRLRLTPAKNNQSRLVHPAEKYLGIDRTAYNRRSRGHSSVG